MLADCFGALWSFVEDCFRFQDFPDGFRRFDDVSAVRLILPETQDVIVELDGPSQLLRVDWGVGIVRNRVPSGIGIESELEEISF